MTTLVTPPARVLDDEAEAYQVCRALANPHRMAILRALAHRTMTMGEIASLTGLSQATVTVHIRELEAVGLISTTVKAAPRHGQQKLCRSTTSAISIPFRSADTAAPFSMPVGFFVDYHVTVTCGMNSITQRLLEFDDPAAFANPRRADAQIVWTGGVGYFEYRFPVLPAADHACGIELSAEVCSEVVESNNKYPSDISLWINGALIATFRSPGDMGGRRGRFTPAWVPLHWTQFGFLARWRCDAKGCWINDKLFAHAPCYHDLRIHQSSDIRVRIGVAPNARHKGGVNIFGRHFGDYDQDILLRWH